MWKYAGELRVGDVWTERPQQRAARTYRVIAIEPGLAPTTMKMTGECVTTGQRRTMDFFLVNRVEVREAMSLSEDAVSASVANANGQGGVRDTCHNGASAPCKSIVRNTRSE